MSDSPDPQAELAKVEATMAQLRELLTGTALDASLAPLLAKHAALHAQLHGAGAVAQGDGAQAASAGGVAVRGDVEQSVVVTGAMLHSTLNVYLQPAGRPALDEAQFERVLGEYLRWVHQSCGKVRLYGLESLRTAAGRPVRGLNKVFVPLTLRRMKLASVALGDGFRR